MIVVDSNDGELQQKFPAIAVSMEDFIKRDMSEGGVREGRASYSARRRR